MARKMCLISKAGISGRRRKPLSFHHGSFRPFQAAHHKVSVGACTHQPSKLSR